MAFYQSLLNDLCQRDDVIVSRRTLFLAKNDLISSVLLSSANDRRKALFSGLSC